MKNLVSRFVKDESGATAIEYGLIAAGIAIAIITAVQGVGTKLSDELQHDLDLAEVSDRRDVRPRAPVIRGLCRLRKLRRFTCRARVARGRFPIVHFSWIGSPHA